MWWDVYLLRRLFPIYSFYHNSSIQKYGIILEMSCPFCTHTYTRTQHIWIHLWKYYEGTTEKDLLRRDVRDFGVRKKEIGDKEGTIALQDERRHCKDQTSGGCDSLGKGCAESIRWWLNYLQCVTESCPLTRRKRK